MNVHDPSLPLDHRPLRPALRTNYKAKLKRNGSAPSKGMEPDVAVLEQEPVYSRQVRALAHHTDAESVAFQCVAAAALQTLERVLYRERRVAEAAISLAQREKLNEMIHTVAATAEAVRATLTSQGQHMLPSASEHDVDEAPEHSWWFALSEALHTLDEGQMWVRSVAAGQPRGSAAHTLSSLIARLLQTHYHAVLAEAEHWMN